MKKKKRKENEHIATHLLLQGNKETNRLEGKTIDGSFGRIYETIYIRYGII